MKLNSKVISGLVAGCAALAAFAGPASAATPSATVTTDAGTTCTISASKNVGSGLLGVSPIEFKGDVGCSLADQAKAPIYSGSAKLTSNLLGLGDVLPLDLGNIAGATAQPNSPSNVETAPPPPGESNGFVCRVDPGYDCGSTGRANGLPATPYQVVHFGTFTAPAGETWTEAPEGCEIGRTGGDEGSAISCTTMTEPFHRLTVSSVSGTADGRAGRDPRPAIFVWRGPSQPRA